MDPHETFKRSILGRDSSSILWSFVEICWVVFCVILPTNQQTHWRTQAKHNLLGGVIVFSPGNWNDEYETTFELSAIFNVIQCQDLVFWACYQ